MAECMKCHAIDRPLSIVSMPLPPPGLLSPVSTAPPRPRKEILCPPCLAVVEVERIKKLMLSDKAFRSVDVNDPWQRMAFTLARHIEPLHSEPVYV